MRGREREGGGSLGSYEHGTRTGILVLDIDSQSDFLSKRIPPHIIFFIFIFRRALVLFYFI